LFHVIQAEELRIIPDAQLHDLAALQPGFLGAARHDQQLPALQPEITLNHL
jgi:hypothetical protein